ncbi:alcohol dehydrogenase AdhP [Microbacterium betulae]|uniref:Alcohol dehydrogenase n=2 Tax=Microbacterium betulae TaxID=2981139 RepID=A0AA97FF01_9MICO|nr:alcohol dehydrogenase AdhP [Microbacterium sp. AB]WOF22421.1 alcohol dehydrogenase AdhP [Microbacterium sp. AB]
MSTPTQSPSVSETPARAATMRAAVVVSPDEPLVVTDVPIPEPGPGQALVRVVTSGVCHTDLHAARGDWPVAPKADLIPGHEGYGEVVALGDGVTTLAVGDLVGNAWLWSACGRCEYCRTGWETLCPEQQNGGYSVDGSFGEYMLVDERFAARIPDGADPVEVAPILCAGVTVYKGLKMTGVRPGEWVTISGIGGLGHIAVQYARALGMRVAAVDVDDAKLELARKHGAEVTVNAAETDPGAAIQEATGGTHGVLVTAVHPRAFGQALAVTRRGATIVFNGLPPGDFPADIFDIVLRAITIRGSIVGTRQDLVEALDFYARGKIHPTVSVETIDDVNDIFERMEHGKIDGRVVMRYADA